MEEISPPSGHNSSSSNKPASSSIQVPLKINFSNRLRTPRSPAAQIGRSPTLDASRRQMLNTQRRFSASFGSPSPDPSTQKLTNILESQPVRSKSPLGCSPEIEPPSSAPMSSAYVERGDARKAREFNHKISFDALHQHYRTGGGRSNSESKPNNSNFIHNGYSREHTGNSLISNSSSPSPPGSLSTPRSLGSLSQIPIQRWSVNQVCYWLKETHLETYIDVFRRNDVNGEVLLELNHQLLKQLGVNTVGPRVRLLQAVKNLCRTTLLDIRADAFSKERTPGRPSAVSGALQGLLNKTLKSSASSPSLRQDSMGVSQNMRNGMLLGESPSFCPLTPASAQPLYTPGRFHRSSPPLSPPPLKTSASPKQVTKAPPEKDIMSLDLVQRHCVRVVGEGGQSRVVDVQNSLHHPQAILAKVMSKFSLPGPPSEYAIFVGTGEQTRMLSDNELMEICNSVSHPNKDKFILRKRYSPPANSARAQRISVQRWDRPVVAAGWDPIATTEPPVVAGEEVVVADAAGYRANRHSKLFTRRPDSKQIASNLAQYFPAQKLMARGSLPQQPAEYSPVPSHRDSEPIPQPLVLELPPTIESTLDETQESVLEAVLDAGLDPVFEVGEDLAVPEPFSPNRCSPLGSPSMLSSGRPARVRVSMDMEGWIQGALIGAGSFGSVYLGLLPTLGDVFAVKQVELPEAASRSENRQKADQVASLRSEIALMRELCHPNIVQYLGSSSTDQHLNIFLEYVPGGSVAARLAERGPFSECRARHYVKQILDGLEYLHGHNIIHRDIKGGNVLIDDKDFAKIADFGVSKKVQDSVLSVITPHRVSLQGSVYWMAPEVVKQTHYTRKADIWSLGCLVIEMLTGDHPFPSFTQMQAIFKIGTYSAPDLPPQASPLTNDFLAATLNPKHALRPSSSELLTHPFVTNVPPPPVSPLYSNIPSDEEPSLLA